MSEVTAILTAEFEALRADLIARYDALGMRATGSWADSLSTEVSGTVAILWQAPHGRQLENGRRPGKQPPSEAIEQWIKARGIAGRLEQGVTTGSLAFLIARKIAREGWDRSQYGGTSLISSVLTPQRIQQIIEKAGHACLNEISEGLISHLKNISI